MSSSTVKNYQPIERQVEAITRTTLPLKTLDTSSYERMPVNLKPTGLSLTYKFIFLICIIITITSTSFIIMSWASVFNEINKSITNSGKQILNLISAIDMDFWRYLHDPKSLVHKHLKEKINDMKSYITQFKPLDINSGDFKRELSRIVEEIIQFQEQLIQTFQSHQDPLAILTKIEPSIMSITVADSAGKLVAGKWFTLSNTTKTEKISDERGNEILIQDGDLKDENGNVNRVKFFQKEITDEEGKIVGTAYLAISTSVIEIVKANLIKIFAIPFFLSLLLAVILGVYLSNSVTKPLKALLEDIKIVASGDFTHKTYPKSSDEFGVIALSFNAMTKSLSKAINDIYQNFLIKQEYTSATKLLSEYLLKIKEKPKIPHVDLSIFYQPSKDVSGDYFDYFWISENLLGISIADVAGKGLSAAVVNTIFKNLMRHEALQNPSPTKTLCRINRTLIGSLKGGMFITNSYMVLNLKTLQIQVVSAGHLPLLVYKDKTNEILAVNPRGVALGFDQRLFESSISEETIQLEIGDKVVAYSDGLTEAVNKEKVPFGLENLKTLLKKYHNKSADEFIVIAKEAIDKFTDYSLTEDKLFDDITLVVFGITK